ncbi:hypothetical protein FRB93_009574 [Tulasnella sp. JGI-2019a]|nr:hypothetical protein FRB93_009574 [Tulasnella sp. JGI-2019a]
MKANNVSYGCREQRPAASDRRRRSDLVMEAATLRPYVEATPVRVSVCLRTVRGDLVRCGLLASDSALAGFLFSPARYV